MTEDEREAGYGERRCRCREGDSGLVGCKSDPELKSIPVVMLTSSRQEQDLTQSYQTGVNAYVVKPIAFPDFVACIKEVGLFWAVVNEPPTGTVPRQH